MDLNKATIIKCPHCGWEYLPSEIFMPGSFYGKPKSVVKDALGKIIYVTWEDDEEPNMTEHFCCDNCDKQFVVTANVTYKTAEEEEELDFKKQTASLIDD